MKRAIAIYTLAAVIFTGAISCKDRFNTKDIVIVKSLFVETKGADTYGNGDNTKFYAEMHALVDNSVEMTSEFFENGDIGFIYGKDPKLAGEVTTISAEDWWTEDEDPLERKGFKGRTDLLPSSQVFFYRAFLKKDGNMEYGLIFSFRTDDAMVSAVTLNKHKETLTVPGTMQLTATVYPEVAINKEVQWSSSREDIATVDQNGLVTAHRPGNTDITVATLEGGKTDVCHLTVKGPDPQAVDLGLSVKWADFNLGAFKPSDPGNYYRWGDTYTAMEYSTSGYKFYYGRDNVPTTSIASGVYDAAYDNLGSPWRMPTKDQFTELKENCTWTKETVDGMAGWRVSGNNGNSIFLPFVGYRQGNPDNTPGLGSTGFYWTANYASGPEYQESAKAWEFRINDEGQALTTNFGHNGHAIRPVRP